MPIPLSNPCNPTGKLWKDLHKISAQVAPDDYFFFKGKFPNDGTIDACRKLNDGWIQIGSMKIDRECLARMAYDIAEAMMEQREKRA